MIGANNIRPFLSDFNITDVLKTADCRVWLPDESTEQVAKEFFPASDHIRIEFQDLSQTPCRQENCLQSSDLIIIRSVPSATKQFEQILQNASQLLTSNGWLCLTVPIQESQDVVALGDAVGITEWIIFDDFKDPHEQQLALLVGSSNTDIANGTKHDDVVIILQSPAPSQTAVDTAAQLKDLLLSLGYTASVISWGNGSLPWKDQAIISLLELDGSILQDIENDDFSRVKSLILEAKSVLWISSLIDPSSAMVAGLSRVVRNEEPGLALRTLHVNLSGCSADRFAEHILRVFQSNGEDSEFMLESEIIHVSRVVENDTLNRKLDLLSPRKTKPIGKVALDEAGSLKLCIQNPGLLDSLCFEHDPLPGTHLEADEIEITVKAASIK